VKPDDTAKLGRRKRRIEKRLSRKTGRGGKPRMLSAGSRRFEVSDRVRATAYGGVGLIQDLVRATGLERRIDDGVQVFKRRGPYTVSDHVLNLAFNVLAGGRTLDNLELRRQDEAYLDLLGAARIPDPTTAGDFLRRFDRSRIDALAEAVNDTRLVVWSEQEASFFERATIDVDGTIAPTGAECMEGVDRAYNGEWGYAPLVVSLANTGELLYLRNRPGNRPSHEGAFEYLDPAVDLARKAGFRSVRLRGDCHFALTENFAHWDKRSVEFVFGVAAHSKLVGMADGLDEAEWSDFERPARTKGGRGEPKPRVREQRVREHGYRNLILEREHLAEFEYRPKKCGRPYRIVALRKTIRVEQGQLTLEPEVRFHFYITNVDADDLSAADVVREANQRCHQENLIEQSKNGFHAMRMPCDTLLANEVHMNVAALAWTLKAWLGLLWPERSEGELLVRMEFRRFVASVMQVPTQVVRSGRRIVQRILGYSQWAGSLIAAHERLRTLRLA
jgi:hypothetical protein